MKKEINIDINKKIVDLALRQGFSDVKVVDITDYSSFQEVIKNHNAFINSNSHGEMNYLENKIKFLKKPDLLLSNAKRAILVNMNYLPKKSNKKWLSVEKQNLKNSNNAVISLYARGRDYHKVLRKRLKNLGSQVSAEMQSFGFRVCVDSAPIFEVELACKAGLGWRGKNTLLLRKNEGSFFFLGVLLTDFPLKTSKAKYSNKCGSCSACIEVCPTKAFEAPYKLNAKKCISYLTIEHKGIIDESLRPLIGNRVFGCDDCQLVCPWNKYAKLATVPDFDVRNDLDSQTLISLFKWEKDEFLARNAGSSILRIGYEGWLRNLAIGLGNSAKYLKKNSKNEKSKEIASEIIFLLKEKLSLKYSNKVLNPHLTWAIDRFRNTGFLD